MNAPPARSELVCVAHVHSTYSDGTATVAEMAAAARGTGADALLLTDHDSLAARRDGWEGWREGVLVMVGHEVSTRHGHYLAFGLDVEIDHRGLSEADICRAVADRGGVGFAAHPFSLGSRMSRRIGRPHPWSALEDEACHGIELWSLVTDAAEAWRSPLDAVRFMRRPGDWLAAPPRASLARWDDLCRGRRVPAIAGLDAHQTGVRVRGRVLSPMPHERYFGLVRTHLLLERPPTGESAPDAALALSALRAGSCFIGVDAHADSRGFRFWAESTNRRVEMGEEAGAGDFQLQAILPRPARVRLLRDGQRVAEVSGDRLVHRTSAAGVYRIEAALELGGRERLWLLSNPIYLRV